MYPFFSCSLSSSLESDEGNPQLAAVNVCACLNVCPMRLTVRRGDVVDPVREEIYTGVNPWIS